MAQDNKQHHTFRLQIGYAPGGGAKITVVSYDASIVYLMDADDTWMREFKSGERTIYVEGYLDLDDNFIYLGKRIEGPTW